MQNDQKTATIKESLKTFNKQFDRVFVTGDIHGDVFDLEARVAKIGDATKDDLLIILGDIAFFYSLFHNDAAKDTARRAYAANLPITLLCVQGNHEQPFCEMDAERIKLLGGDGYERDGIYFASNGTTLDINGNSCLVVGGAYSVDKPWRLLRGNAWWQNEELTDAELLDIQAATKGKRFDFVLTHTCPFNFLPREMFLAEIDQSRVENRTEKALQMIHDSIKFGKWFCGHFHTDKFDGKIEFFYKGIKQII